MSYIFQLILDLRPYWTTEEASGLGIQWIKMQEPDLDLMWETFIRIPQTANPINIIRSQVYPLISRLKGKDIMNWYSFLIHDRRSGVPTSEDDDNPYFHIRFDLKRTIDPTDFLPDYCLMTRRIGRSDVEDITGIVKFLLRGERIEEAWRIIGEQSKWLLNMLNIHKEDFDVPPDQIRQFLHYFSNMSALQIICPNCGYRHPLWWRRTKETAWFSLAQVLSWLLGISSE